MDDPGDGWLTAPLTGADAERAARADDRQRRAIEAARQRSDGLFDAAGPALKRRITKDVTKKVRKDIERERGLARHTQSLRIATAMRMRRQGSSNAEIGRKLGITAGAVSRLIGDALRDHRYDDTEVEAYKDYFIEALLSKMAVIEDTIASPGYLFDVKGDLVTGPDGQFLENTSERIKAVTEWRHLQESARKLLGTDAPQKKIRHDTLIIKNIREVARELGIPDGTEPPDIVEGIFTELPAQEPGWPDDDTPAAGGIQLLGDDVRDRAQPETDSDESRPVRARHHEPGDDTRDEEKYRGDDV